MLVKFFLNYRLKFFFVNQAKFTRNSRRIYYKTTDLTKNIPKQDLNMHEELY
jgi:hypothetical protein